MKLQDYIHVICILHNMLIEHNVPILPELDVPREAEFDSIGRGPEYANVFHQSREIRNGIAKYLSMLPEYAMNQYPTTL